MTSLVLLTACRTDSQPTTKPVTFTDDEDSTEQLCSDSDANALPVAEDADCDGIPTADDCDDNNPQLGASSHDNDCDGILTTDDCDDNDQYIGAQSNDNDCDGIPAADDCDDSDSNALSSIEDVDCDGISTADDCDDNAPNLGAIVEDDDCDGILNEDDWVDNTSTLQYGLGFQHPVATDWNFFLGEYAWTRHAELVADLDTDNYASSQHYIMRVYTSMDWITTYNQTTIDWRAGSTEARDAIKAMADGDFQGHVDIILRRLKTAEEEYLASRTPEQLALLQDGSHIYAPDPEVTLWDRSFFHELSSSTFAVAFLQTNGFDYAQKKSVYTYFTETEDENGLSYTPTTKWKIIGEAIIEHLEYCKTLLGHPKVSHYGGPWEVYYMDMSRAVHGSGLSDEQLKETVANAMLLVRDVELQTGTMQRFIDTMFVNGAQWYPPMNNFFELNQDRWGQVYFDALVYGLQKASEDASPGHPKGGLWFHTGKFTTFENRVQESDARFTNRLWPDAPDMANFSVVDSALFKPTRLGTEQQGLEATWPIPGGIVTYMAAELKANHIYGFGFLPIGTLKQNPLAIEGLNNVIWDDPAWNYGVPLDPNDQASNEFVVDLYYQHMLSGIRK